MAFHFYLHHLIALQTGKPPLPQFLFAFILTSKLWTFCHPLILSHLPLFSVEKPKESSCLFCPLFQFTFIFHPQKSMMLFLLLFRMPEFELKSLINDLLNKIPDDVQMNLSTSISQLNDFLHDICDFPHKCIPMKTFPIGIKDIFHRIANNCDNNNDYHGGYNHEQLITMDLVLNPNRFSSWYTMLNIKISQLNTLITDTYDLTK